MEDAGSQSAPQYAAVACFATARCSCTGFFAPSESMAASSMAFDAASTNFLACGRLTDSVSLIILVLSWRDLSCMISLLHSARHMFGIMVLTTMV